MAESDMATPAFTPLTEHPPGNEPAQWTRIQDVPLTMTIELGHTTLNLQALAQLGPGHTIVLDQFVGEPVVCRLNGVLVARGEIGVQGDRYTVQIREVITERPAVSLTDDEED